jgi:hypothetical protein
LQLSMGCSLKFPIEESIINTPRITNLISCLNIKSLFALFLIWRLKSGAFTIDSPTPTLTGN